MTSTVTYHFYRNATAKLTFGGLTFLLDPMLSPKGLLPSFAGIEANPTVDLPTDIDSIVHGVNAVIVSHLHQDHFDDVAAKSLDKNLPMLTPRNAAPTDISQPAQTTSFVESLRGMGFTNVIEIGSDHSRQLTFEGITIHQVFARHGDGVLSDLMGGVNGLVFQSKGCPTIYWAGDTVLDHDGQIAAVLQRFKPDIIIAHTGGPVIEALAPEPLLMDASQAIEFLKLAIEANPRVEFVAVHMEALDHCFCSRDDLRKALQSMPESDRGRVTIPEDGSVHVLHQDR